MTSGLRVSWNTSMGVSNGTTISEQYVDGYILVAMDGFNGIRQVFYLLVSNLTIIS